MIGESCWKAGPLECAPILLDTGGFLVAGMLEVLLLCGIPSFTLSPKRESLLLRASRGICDFLGDDFWLVGNFRDS